MPRSRTAQHGTRSKYNAGCRCTDCRRANSEYLRVWELKRGIKKYGAEEWERVRPRARHGSVYMYSGGCRCAECRNACRVYRGERREAFQSGRSQMPARHHGTPYGYQYFGCRCERCRAAWNEKCRKDDQRRRELNGDGWPCAMCDFVGVSERGLKIHVTARNHQGVSS